MVFDRGAEGKYRGNFIDQGALKEVQDVVGMPPRMGQKWVMIQIDTGEAKWYVSVSSGRKYRRRRR